MQFHWKHYCDSDADLVNTWLDDYAIIQTGMEGGWQDFYDYWMTEDPGEGKDCCFIISQDDSPCAVMYVGITGAELTVSEYLVAPDKRGKGYGSAILKELLNNTIQLLNITPSIAKAVIYPSNIASIKAFEKAGFVLASRHPDGDALHYEYGFDSDDVKPMNRTV